MNHKCLQLVLAGALALFPKIVPAQVPTIGSAPLIFPHFAQGGGYQTGFTLTNLSTTSTNVTVTSYSSAGAIVNSSVVPLPGSGAATIAMTGSTLTVGWTSMSASPPCDFVGTETIQLFNTVGGLVMEASVLAAQSDVTLRLPVYEKNGFGTGVAIVNAGTSASAVTMTLRNSNGTVARTATLSLVPSQHNAQYVSELFTGVTNFEGTLELSAPQAISALALRQNFSSGIFSTLPVSAS